MRALHYAAYFDVPQLIRVVLQASQPGGERIATLWMVERGKGHPSGSAQGKLFSAAVGVITVIIVFQMNTLISDFMECERQKNPMKSKTTYRGGFDWIQIQFLSM